MSVIRAAAYPQNVPIAELRTAEMYLVCAARLWVAHHRGVEGAARDLDRGFSAAGDADDNIGNKASKPRRTRKTAAKKAGAATTRRASTRRKKE